MDDRASDLVDQIYDEEGLAYAEQLVVLQGLRMCQLEEYAVAVAEVLEEVLLPLQGEFDLEVSPAMSAVFLLARDDEVVYCLFLPDD